MNLAGDLESSKGVYLATVNRGEIQVQKYVDPMGTAKACNGVGGYKNTMQRPR